MIVRSSRFRSKYASRPLLPPLNYAQSNLLSSLMMGLASPPFPLFLLGGQTRNYFRSQCSLSLTASSFLFPPDSVFESSCRVSPNKKRRLSFLKTFSIPFFPLDIERESHPKFFEHGKSGPWLFSERDLTQFFASH